MSQETPQEDIVTPLTQGFRDYIALDMKTASYDNLRLVAAQLCNRADQIALEDDILFIRQARLTLQVARTFEQGNTETDSLTKKVLLQSITNAIQLLETRENELIDEIATTVSAAGLI